jgi:hypothetical protein
MMLQTSFVDSLLFAQPIVRHFVMPLVPQSACCLILKSFSRCLTKEKGKAASFGGFNLNFKCVNQAKLQQVP